MALFLPYRDYHRILDITKEDFEKMGIRGLILDVDNTLTTHDNPVPLENVTDWLSEMQKSGIKMMIVSNNHGERVEPFAKMLGLDFVSEGKKPLSDGFKRAINLMGLSKEQVAVIGDQIFTDILGANLFRIKSILVTPIEPEKKGFLHFKRIMEKPILQHYNKIKSKRRQK